MTTEVYIKQEELIPVADLTMSDGLERRHSPVSLAQVCDECGISVQEAEQYLRIKIKEVLDFCRKNKRSIDNGLWPGIEVMYRFYLAAEQEDLVKKYSLDSFETFWSNYAKKYKTATKSNFRRRIGAFVQRMIHPSRIFIINDLRSSRWDCPTYNWQGTWIRYQESKDAKTGELETAKYVDEKVVTKTLELSATGQSLNSDYYHVTTSKSLGGIASHKAILSSSQLEKNGMPPKTGEYVDRASEVTKGSLAKDSGLTHIYADEADPRYGYATIDWFSEFAVGFGINRKKLETYYEAKGGKFEPQVLYYGDGTVLGDTVPLDCVDIIYCDYIHLTAMEKWIQENNLRILVVPNETRQLIQEFGSGKNLSELPTIIGELLNKNKEVLLQAEKPEGFQMKN